MTDFDAANQSAIDGLNQRGGRMLSLVDLVAADTLSLDAAALLAWSAAHGASIITAAGPGGVGKSTLLGACLAFLPASTECVAVCDESVLDRPAPAAHPRCLLVHEINRGPYFGYLWGPGIGRLTSMIGPGCSIAATLHAESCAEALAKLSAPPLHARAEDLARIDVVAVMSAADGRRRITQLRAGDRAPAAELAAYRALLSQALARDIRRMELLRALARRTIASEA